MIRFAWSAVFAVAAVLAPQCAAQTLTTLIENGASANRVDVVFLGDGYTQADLDAGQYTNDVNAYIDSFFAGALADPFPRYRNFFNVHLIEVVSNESGADQPPNDIFRDTALDATYFSFGTERLLTISNSKANAARDSALAGTSITADMQYAVVNDTKYGGAGGAWATFSGGNANAHEIALHEVGHSFSDLADEYFTPGAEYGGNEPPEVNVTADPTSGKWSQWIGFDDPRGSHLDIGVFEGGRYHETGIYRPSDRSKMRSLDRAFDAVSREKIVLDIYDLVEPLDSHLENTATLVDPMSLWVEVVDPDVIGVEWYVDGVLSTVNQGESFDPVAEGLGEGVWNVSARAYDRVLDSAFDGSLLDLVRRDQDRLEQSVAWSIELSPVAPLVGDYNADGLVDTLDHAVWSDAYGLTDIDPDTPHPADGNGDRQVDAADYGIWRDAATAAAPAAVPEPLALRLLLCLPLAWALRRR